MVFVNSCYLIKVYLFDEIIRGTAWYNEVCKYTKNILSMPYFMLSNKLKINLLDVSICFKIFNHSLSETSMWASI